MARLAAVALSCVAPSGRRLLAVTNRREPMLRPDQEPVADDRRRRHGEVVERIDANEPILIGRVDDERVPLFTQREDVPVVGPR